MRADLQALLERVEKAEGPDRELDDAIDKWKLDTLLTRDTSARFALICPPYTASIDAAVALVEKMLPGWKWCVQREIHPDNWFFAYVFIVNEGTSFADHRGMAHGPALALIAALLRALIAQEKA